MADTLIFAEDGYTIWKEQAVGSDLVDLLEHTSWGGAQLRYHHYLSEQRLAQIPDPHIFTLRIEGELLAAIVFCRRTLHHLDTQLGGYYIRFFAASPKVKGKGLIRLISHKVMDWVREEEAQPTLYYASVEANNHASNRIVSEVGFRALTTLQTVAFSRLWPRRRLAIERLDEAGFADFLPTLQHAYRHHQAWHTDNLNLAPGYWVVRDESGEIVLGAQVHEAKWTIETIPGRIGRLLPILPKLPLLRRIFNPADFRFLAFEALYARDGDARQWPEFLESLLHQFGYYAAMGWFDVRDPLLADLTGSGNLGWLGYFSQRATVKFMVCPHRLSEDQLTNLGSDACYVSALDYT